MFLSSEHRLLHYVKTTYTKKPTREEKAATVAAQDATHAQAISGATGITPTLGTAAPPSYINLQTPGGTIGYDTREFAPTTDESGAVTGVTPRTQAPSKIPANAPAGWTDTSGLSPLTVLGVPETPDQFAARVAALEARNVALMQQQEIRQGQAEKRATAQAASGAAAAAAQVQNPVTGQNYSGAAGERLQGRLDEGSVFMNPVDRQDYIESRRAQGATDAQIREEIDTLPPEQTGGAPAPAAPKPAKGTKPTTAGKPASTAEGDEAAPAPIVNPNSNAIRQLATTVDDPILAIALNMEADRADALAVEDAVSQAAFNAGEDGQAIAKPYDAIDEILDRASARAEKMYASQEAFLKGQYERNDKLLASKEENIKNQLSFQNDKAVRDQTDANKKLLDSKTIMLALQGGFGSSDGNAEIAEARLKGEQAIVDLNKEFGFKKTDVSLAFTEMHNEAFDKYQQAWLTATDNFESRVSNLDLQGISNQQAKSNALGSAYKSYVTEIKEARKEQAKILSDATKFVYTAIQAEKAAKATEARQTKDDAYQLFNFAFASSTDPALRKAAVNAMNAAGYDLPKDIDLNALPPTMQLKAMQDAKDSAAAGLTDPFRFPAGEQRQIMSDAYQAVSSLPVATQGPMLEQVARMLDMGDAKGAQDKLRSIAVSSLNDTQRDAYSDRSVVLNSINQLDGTLTKLEKSGRGIYKQKYQSAKKLANQSQDADFLAVSSALENIASVMIKERYGANVTGPEWERAKQYIPLSGDTVLDAIGKLRQLKVVLEDKQNEVVNTKIGRFSSGGTFSPSSSYNDDYFKPVVLPGGSPQTSSSGMRTDRHNNPTAMTTDVAKTAGLVEGVDYVAGDAFPNNPNLRTARLLGDPVATTIKAIDKMGFYTQRGQQRWTHTAIPQSEWAGMNYSQKAKVIRDMYKREGGSALASLFTNV